MSYIYDWYFTDDKLPVIKWLCSCVYAILIYICICSITDIYPFLFINIVSQIDIYIQIHRIWVRQWVSKVNLAALVEGDPKPPFSIVTTPRCKEGRDSIPRIAPLYPLSSP